MATVQCVPEKMALNLQHHNFATVHHTVMQFLA